MFASIASVRHKFYTLTKKVIPIENELKCYEWKYYDFIDIIEVICDRIIKT